VLTLTSSDVTQRKGVWLLEPLTEKLLVLEPGQRKTLGKTHDHGYNTMHVIVTTAFAASMDVTPTSNEGVFLLW
jgi:hypothetical protein